MCQGFLRVAVFTHVDRLHRDRRVHVIRRRDIATIDLVALGREELAPVLVNSGVREFLAHFFRSGEIDFGDRDKFDVGMLRDVAQITSRHAVGPETGVLELVIGRTLSSEDKRAGGNRGSSGFEEVAASFHVVDDLKELEPSPPRAASSESPICN